MFIRYFVHLAQSFLVGAKAQTRKANSRKAVESAQFLERGQKAIRCIHHLLTEARDLEPVFDYNDNIVRVANFPEPSWWDGVAVPTKCSTTNVAPIVINFYKSFGRNYMEPTPHRQSAAEAAGFNEATWVSRFHKAGNALQVSGPQALMVNPCTGRALTVDTSGVVSQACLADAACKAEFDTREQLRKHHVFLGLIPGEPPSSFATEDFASLENDGDAIGDPQELEEMDGIDVAVPGTTVGLDGSIFVAMSAEAMALQETFDETNPDEDDTDPEEDLVQYDENMEPEDELEEQ